MTSDRTYRAALGRDAALEELRRCAGSQFDPQVVRAFLALAARPEGENGPRWAATASSRA